MLLTLLEIAVYAIERLAIAFLIIFALIGLGATRCHGQVVVAAEPSLAPPDCYCGQSCKCSPCECNAKSKPPVVSVKKPEVTVPNRASVKLSVSVKGVSSVASGTVIESDGTKSKVLTCWHLFRDPGDIKVHLLNGTAVDGRILKSNSKLDLALVEFDGSHDYVPFSKEQATSGLTAYGYESGGELKAFPTKIIGYYNYPDARVLGRAKPGRSGGGLFSPKGEVVGVCSASGPDSSNESVYISYPAVEQFLFGKMQASAKASVPRADCPTGTCPLLPKAAPPSKASPSERRTKPVSPSVRGF